MQHSAQIRDVGDLDRVIQIYNRNATDTDFAFTESNVLLSTEWAQEVPKTRTMQEVIAGGKESSLQEVHFRIRKETTVTTRDYVKYDSDWYDVITILPEGRDYKVLVTTLKPDAQWP
jgi:head-tail adaptor